MEDVGEKVGIDETMPRSNPRNNHKQNQVKVTNNVRAKINGTKIFS